MFRLKNPFLEVRPMATVSWTIAKAKESEVTQSYLTLWDPVDCSPPGSSVHGILQARVLEWVAIPSPGDLPNPGIKPRSPTLQADALPSKQPAKCWTIRVQQITSAFQASFLREVAASELTETSWLWKKTARTKFPRTEQTGWPGRVTQGSYHSAWHPGESATGAQRTGLWWLVLEVQNIGCLKKDNSPKLLKGSAQTTGPGQINPSLRREFPDSPEVRMPCFHSWKVGSIPGLETKIPCAIWCGQKEKEKKEIQVWQDCPNTIEFIKILSYTFFNIKKAEHERIDAF